MLALVYSPDSGIAYKRSNFVSIVSAGAISRVGQLCLLHMYLSFNRSYLFGKPRSAVTVSITSHSWSSWSLGPRSHFDATRFTQTDTYDMAPELLEVILSMIESAGSPEKIAKIEHSMDCQYFFFDADMQY